jgi:hypothetical protein
MLVINQQTGVTHILFSTHMINAYIILNLTLFVYCESKQVNNMDTEQSQENITSVSSCWYNKISLKLL